jgi:hypothetical protein
MTNERRTLPKNAGKVEFIAHAETIKSLLNEGYNLRNIYNKLRQLDNFTMSYNTLCDWYRKTIKEEKSKGQVKKTATPPATQKMPAISSSPAAPQKLTRPEDIDRGTLF